MALLGDNMKDYKVLLTIARDEIDTLIKYSEMLEESQNKEVLDETVKKIMSDEFNHALIALLSASNLMEVEIATDDLSEDPNEIEVE